MNRIETTLPSFRCPRCGLRSYNPHDVRFGYCAKCDAFTRDEVWPPRSSWDGTFERDAPRWLLVLIIGLLLGGVGLVTWWGRG